VISFLAYGYSPYFTTTAMMLRLWSIHHYQLPRLAAHSLSSFIIGGGKHYSTLLSPPMMMMMMIAYSTIRPPTTAITIITSCSLVVEDVSIVIVEDEIDSRRWMMIVTLNCITSPQTLLLHHCHAMPSIRGQ
jgi:hypothetical protein